MAASGMALATASGVRPGIDFVEEMIAQSDPTIGAGFEEVGQWEYDTGCQQGNQQDHAARNSEPAWGQTGEEKNDEFITGDGEPVDEDIQMIGGGGPLGYNNECVEEHDGD